MDNKLPVEEIDSWSGDLVTFNENNLNEFIFYSEKTFMIFAKQLKELLKDRDVTTAQLARATNISSKTIYQWLNGQNPRDLKQVKKIADHFGVTIDFLAFGIERDRKINIEDFEEEINAGIFEVRLRKVKTKTKENI